MAGGRLFIVVGGQWGSEAKGKATQWLIENEKLSLAVRAGGINAGHTVGLRSKYMHGPNAPVVTVPFITRTLPSGIAVPTCDVALAPGAIVEPGLLEDELYRLKQVGYDVHRRLWVDRAAFVLEKKLDKEREMGWAKGNGSTETGTGAALVRRIERNNGSRVGTDPRFSAYQKVDVARMIQDRLYSGSGVILEGTQGFGLSNIHGPWPYCTSRDTTAMAVLSECGVPGWSHPTKSPWEVKVCMVVRTHPIRVGGPSGPMGRETSWDHVMEGAGRTDHVTEMTSVTKRVRRVAEFDEDTFIRAVRANHPSFIALHGADYLNGTDLGITTWEGLSDETKKFAAHLESLSDGVPVKLIFTGPDQDAIVHLENGVPR